MPRARQPQSKRPVRIAFDSPLIIDCKTTDGVLDVVSFCQRWGIHPHIGPAPFLIGEDGAVEATDDAAAAAPNRRHAGGRAEKGKGSRPKRYLAKMVVKLAAIPANANLPPQSIKVHAALKDIYGDRPFVKGEAKAQLLSRGLSNFTGYVTRLMDAGALVPANELPQPPITPAALDALATVPAREEGNGHDAVEPLTPALAKQANKAVKLKSNGKKIVRWPGNMLIRAVDVPKDAQLRPQALKAHAAIRKEYGEEPFVKARTGAILKKLKMPTANSMITALLDQGALVRA